MLRLVSAPSTAIPLQSSSVEERALSGDPEAEREVCRRLLPAVRAFATRRLRAASAEDFAHDVMLSLIEAMRAGRVQEPARLAGFALGICRNLARDRTRLDERRRELLQRYGFGPEDWVTDETPSWVRREHLEDCYSQLTDRARRVLRATFCNEDLDSDIARDLALTPANVRIIRHRTLAALRACLDQPISWVQS